MRAIICVAFLVFGLSFAQNDPPKDDTTWTELRRSDFDAGTYIISSPGYYRLVEDVDFDPLRPADENGAYDAYYLRSSDFTTGGGNYDEQAYTLGFWSAITILTDHVTLDLGGHTIGQSKSHNLMNRFFHVIQLGTLTNNGYWQFTQPNTTMAKVDFVTIQNGRIGRSARNGIYGTLNTNLLLKDLTFDGFERNALVLSGPVNIQLQNCHAYSSKEVPVNQNWFTAVNIRPYLDALLKASPAYSITVGGAIVSGSSIQQDLKTYVNTVYKRVVTENAWLDGSKDYEEVSALFGNDWRRPDSNCGGFSFSRWGVAPPGIGTDPTNITIVDSSVRDLECAPYETVGITATTGQVIVNGVRRYTYSPVQDPRGNSFSLLGFDWDWTKPKATFGAANAMPWEVLTVQDPYDITKAVYNGNALTNAQAIVAKAILDGTLKPTNTFQLSLARFNQDLLDWIAADPATSSALLSNYVKAGTTLKRPFICSGDVQSTSLLGIYPISLTNAHFVTIQRVVVEGIKNWGAKGSGVCTYTNSTKMISGSLYPGFNGADAKAFFFFSCENVTINSVFVGQVHSNFGSLIAFDIINATQFATLTDVEVRDFYSGEQLRASERATYETQATRWPSAVAFHTDVTTKNITLNPYCVNNLNAPTGQAFKTSLANNTVDSGETLSCHIGDYPWWIWFLLAIVSIIFIVALIAVLMACLEQNKEVEGEHYTQMN